MAWSSLYGYYKIGRFIFAVALLVVFHMVGLLSAYPLLSYILLVYCFIAIIRLMTTNDSIGYLDFLFDIVFISALIYVSFTVYSYMTLFYLFPVFFASIVIKTRKIFIYPLIAILIYAAIFLVHGVALSNDVLLNLCLHTFSFFIIAFAGHSLKEKTDRQEAYIRLLEEERIKMQGYERLYRVSADLAHELRNPLASISASVQFLKEGKKISDFIGMLDSETTRLTNLVNDFLMFSRPSDAPVEMVELSALVRIIITRQPEGKAISAHIEDGLYIAANRIFIDVALTNIIKNAIEAAKSAVFISLKSVSSDVQAKHKVDVVLEVEDDGHGIDDANKDRIFEPFFTTKSSGTGLGLAIAYRVITSFGGNIIADRSPHGGAKFTVVMPQSMDTTKKR